MARSMSDHPESEPFRLADSVSHLLHRAEQLASDRFAQLVSEGVTLRQFAVLAAIAESPGLSQADLVRATGIDRSTLGEMMPRMQRRGWIDRTISKADKRSQSVALTPAGATVLKAAVQPARAADAAILDLLPRTKARALVNTLNKLSKLYDEAIAKAEHEARRQAKREARAKHREKARQKRREKKQREKEEAKSRPKRNK